MRYTSVMLPLTVLGLSPWLLGLLAVGFGAIIGSFLNVLIYRMHTGRSLNGRSHCLSCGRLLRWYHLVPVVSYLALRGRCGHCGARFTARYAAVEVFTASLFALAALVAVDVVDLLLLWTIMSVLVVVVVYDLRHLIIPDELVIVLTLLVTARSGYWAWLYLESALPFLATAVAGFAVAGFFFLLWYISGGRWLGFGDVKLSFPLTLLVGSAGAFSMVVLSFWVGAGVSLALLGLGTLGKQLRGKTTVWFAGAALTMKSAVPFAPFLVAGALLVFFYHVDVLSLFTWNTL